MGIQRIEEFTASVNAAKSLAQIEQVCVRELEYLRREYNVQDTANDKGIFSGLATYKRAITNYRKNIYLHSKREALEFLNLTPNEKSNFEEQNRTASFRNISNNDIWHTHVILNTDGYIQKSIELLTKPSHVDNILGLTALTGRRIGEIGFYSDFELLESQAEFDNEYKYYNMSGWDGIRVNNLSKKQTYRMGKINVSAIIPVLYDPTTIYNSFNDMRKNKTYISFEKFHNSVSKEAAMRVKKHFSEFLGVCTIHDLRKAYARIVFDYAADLPDEVLPVLITKILVQSVPANYLKFSSS